MYMKNNSGVSFVELLFVLAALGGISLIVTNLGKSSASLQNAAVITRDYNDIVRESHFLLSNSNFCKASLSGLTFKAEDVKRPLSNIELWTSDDKGEKRVQKRFATSAKIGSLLIESITLRLAKNFSIPINSRGVVIQGTTGIIKIELTRTKAGASAKMISDIEQTINLTVSSDQSTGQSTILDCGDSNANNKENSKVWCGTVLNPCGSENIQSVAIGKYENGKFTGIFEPILSISETKICHGAVNQPAILAPCESHFSDK
jgi:hypothetical protein